MKSEVGSRKSEVGSRETIYLKQFFLFCLLSSVFCLLASCSIPNLESPDCIEARDAVKRFYSLHFDKEMRPSEEYLKLRAPFITENFRFFISKQINSPVDFFTLEENAPKAFRIGECKQIDAQNVEFEILLFWKDDAQSRQENIHVKAVKENEKWLISSVET